MPQCTGGAARNEAAATRGGGCFWRRLICGPLQLVVPPDVARLSISATTTTSSLLLKIQLHAQTDDGAGEQGDAELAGLTG